MSHSTTATTTHILAKYSKSYPQPASSSDPSVNADAEWQHFVNPVIRLLLDIKKSLKGELESFRLRILWSMNTGDDSMDVDQRDVGFEDLDLLAFSPLSSFKPQQRSQCLPLKAVYRDAVVGIRYLHPRVATTGCRPVYRRFQITFMSTTAASQFIDMIRNVCPCKANSTPGPARNMTMNPHPATGATNVSGNLYAPSNRRPISIAFPPASNHPTTPLRILETPSRAPGTQSSPLELSSSPVLTLFSSQMDTPGIHHSSFNHDSFSRPSTSSSTAPPFLPNNETFYQNTGPAYDNIRRTGNSTASDEAGKRVTESVVNKPSVPDSSPPSSSFNSSQGVMLPPPPPIAAQTLPQTATPSVPNPSLHTESASAQDSFLASLRETPTLYHLSRTELEKLVGDVVREEGFAKLLENLDSMWKMKGFLGH